ncbi:MAG: DUF488 domain-containing protein [Candidatus Hadarchaeales archaeon]
MGRIYTVGYGNMSADEFLYLLEANGVELVIDVRRFPTSKYPEFVKENLEKMLGQRGMGYLHIHELGGYRGGYRRYMETDEFRKGIERLLRAAGERTSAIMCVESSPSGCHRRYISSELERLGWEVVHLRKSAGA